MKKHLIAAAAACALGIFSAPSGTRADSGNPTIPPIQPQPPGKATISVPAEFQPAVSAMYSAKTALEQAGEKYGGHRLRAIHLIDQALIACGQQPVRAGEAKSGPTDVAVYLETGTRQLTNAKDVLSQVTNNWDGRRDKALALVNHALQELAAAAAFAKNQVKKPAKP